MSILSLTEKISEKFLKSNGFEKTNAWGAPYRWNENTVHFIKTICINGHSCVIIYFPENFKGYVTPYGFNAANHTLCIFSDCNSDIHLSIEDEADIHYVIGLVKNKLKQ